MKLGRDPIPVVLSICILISVPQQADAENDLTLEDLAVKVKAYESGFPAFSASWTEIASYPASDRKVTSYYEEQWSLADGYHLIREFHDDQMNVHFGQECVYSASENAFYHLRTSVPQHAKNPGGAVTHGLEAALGVTDFKLHNLTLLSRYYSGVALTGKPNSGTEYCAYFSDLLGWGGTALISVDPPVVRIREYENSELDMEFDPEKGYAVRRFEFRFAADVRTVVENVEWMEVKPGLWFPNKARIMSYLVGQHEQTRELVVDAFEVLEEFPEGTFSVDLTPPYHDDRIDATVGEVPKPSGEGAPTDQAATRALSCPEGEAVAAYPGETRTMPSDE